ISQNFSICGTLWAFEKQLAYYEKYRFIPHCGRLRSCVGCAKYYLGIRLRYFKHSIQNLVYKCYEFILPSFGMSKREFKRCWESWLKWLNRLTLGQFTYFRADESQDNGKNSFLFHRNVAVFSAGEISCELAAQKWLDLYNKISKIKRQIYSFTAR